MPANPDSTNSPMMTCRERKLAVSLAAACQTSATAPSTISTSGTNCNACSSCSSRMSSVIVPMSPSTITPRIHRRSRSRTTLSASAFGRPASMRGSLPGLFVVLFVVLLLFLAARLFHHQRQRRVVLGVDRRHHCGHLRHVRLFGHQRLLDLDHALLDRHIGVLGAGLDQVLDRIPAVVEGLVGLARL